MRGNVLIDRYELMEKIGDGGMAVVYKGHDRILDRIVAVKILKDEFSADSSFVEKFKTEAQAAAKLSHPNIVNIYDVGQDQNIYFIVMELVEGWTLKDLIDKEAPLNVEKAVDIAIMICDGIHHAHERGIIHKDIKPHNILITANGIVKVADFGIAQAISKKTITFGGDIVGSVQYISPEQAKGEPVTRATDIYSLGCVLYEMLTGKVPFDAESPVTVALKHIHDEPVSPAEYNKSIPPSLQEIIQKAMEKIPRYRFTTAEEMRNALISFHQGGSVNHFRRHSKEKTIIMSPVLTEGNEDELARKKKVRPGGIVLIAVAILGLLSGILYVLGGSFFGQEVVVPNIIGKESKAAKKELDKLGLNMTVIRQDYSSEVEKDKIISQNPIAGMKVKEGRSIDVVLSKGVQLQKVPALVGMKLSDAELSLKNEGLELGEVEERYDEKYAEDYVISQNPRADSEVKEGSKVDLLVSKGEQPERVRMPKLIGLNINDARKKLQENNLLLGDIREKESDEYYTDQVIAQDTEAGVLVDENSTVILTISKGPGPVAQTKAIEFQLPTDQDYYKVVIYLTDAKGRREVYNQLQQAGETVFAGISYFGSGKAEVYLNGKYHKTFNL